jgi:hypothetical protein
MDVAECVSTATFYINILVNHESGKLPHESIFGVKFKNLSNLKELGEMIVVTTKKKIQGKLSNRGTVCMFVGFSQNHSNHFYCLLNFKTRQVIKSINLIWLNKDYEIWASQKQDNES